MIKRRLQGRRIIALLTAGMLSVSTIAPHMSAYATESNTEIDTISEEGSTEETRETKETQMFRTGSTEETKETETPRTDGTEETKETEAPRTDHTKEEKETETPGTDHTNEEKETETSRTDHTKEEKETEMPGTDHTEETGKTEISEEDSPEETKDNSTEGTAEEDTDETIVTEEDKQNDAEEGSEIGTTIINGDFETGDASGWTLLDGTPLTEENNKVGVVSDAQTYWGSRSFYKQGNYFLQGDPKEGEAGAIRSNTFKLGGDGYISFLIGTASAEGKGCVKIYEETENEDILIKTYINQNWKDPETGLTLLRIYDKLDEYKDKALYFVVENGSEAGFSFISVDDFRVSMIFEEVKQLYLEDAARIRQIEDEHSEYICGLYRDAVFYGTEEKVGENLATGEAALEKCLETPVDMEADSTIDVVKMIRDETVVKDQFGIRVPFDITINQIIHKETEENVTKDAASLLLEAGTYEVSYKISYSSKGESTDVDKAFVINASEKQEAGLSIINGDFETGDLTGWKLLDGKAATNENNDVGIVSDEETYWGNRAIYKQGIYCLRGDSKEGKAGAIRSSSFKLGGDGYITFLIGAAAAEGKGCVRLYEKTGAEDILVRTYTNKNWNDPKTGLTLIRVYDKLDESYIGKELYFVVENGSEAGFSFINVDDFRTSLTEAEVKTLQEETLEQIQVIEDDYKDYIISCYRKNGIINDIILQKEMPETIQKYEGVMLNLPETIALSTKAVKSYSLENVEVGITIDSVQYDESEMEDPDGFQAMELKKGTYLVRYTRTYGDITESDKTLTINVREVDSTIHEVENGGFETGDLSGWEVIHEEVWNKDENGDPKGVVSAETYWGEKLPYNQEGKYHVDGWAVTDDEQAAWGIRSSVFTLAGSGYISVRMGGNAAQIRIYKLDGTLIGSYNQNRFRDENFPFAGDGDGCGSWADMGTYFIDLQEYMGEPLYIELRDRNITQGWAHAFFDDVRCYYEQEPDVENGFDTVTAPVGRDENNDLIYEEVQLKWTLLTYSRKILTLSFEEEGFTVRNAAGKKEDTEIHSVFREPAYQDSPVEPYRPNGIVGKALNFDGYSNYAEFHETVEGSKLTIDSYVVPRAFMWDAPATPHEDRIAEVIVGSYATAAKKGFVLGVTKHGHLAFRAGTGDNWYSLSSDEKHTIPLYEWSRVTAVFDGDKGVMSLYLNGESVATKAVEKGSEIVSSGKPICIGKGSEPILVADNLFDGTMFPGLMDEISISHTALTDESVKEAGKELPVISYAEAMAPDSALTGDYYRPVYHAVPPASWMNEPHALFQYKGKWHLFYQTNQGGPFWHNISWGHWVSDNMVNWKFVKEAVVPTEGTVSPDGVWTGNMIYTSDGEPLLLITLGDDSRPVNGSNQHVGLVRAVDYSDPELTEWEIIGYAVAQTGAMGTPGEFRDAQAFGIGNDRYMVVGGASDGRGVAHVFKTEAKTLTEWENACKDGALNGMNWEYKGNLLGDFFGKNTYKPEYGTVWEMPNLVPLRDENGKETDKYLFVFSPQHGDNDVWYYIGEFDQEHCVFTPDYPDAKLMDYGNNIFTGPTVYVNPADGRVYICSVMQDNSEGQPVGRTVDEHMKAGWAFYAGLPRELYLKQDGTLGIKNIDTSSIEGRTLASFENLTVAEANEKLANVASDTIKIEFEFAGDASEIGFFLKKSADNSSRFFVTNDHLGLDGVSGAYSRGDVLKGVIYVDKCSIEAYVDHTVTISGSKFFRGMGLEVFASGDVKCSVTVTEMKSIHNNAGTNTGTGTGTGSGTDNDNNDDNDNDNNDDNNGDDQPDVPVSVPDGLWIAGIEDGGYAYTGVQIKPEVRVYDRDQLLRAGKDYTITYKNNTKANNAADVQTAPVIIVKGKGNYTGKATAVFKINPVDLNSPDIQADDIAVGYNKKVQKKVPVLTYNGKKLVHKKDFTVSYPDTGANGYKERGEYNIILTAAGGNYTGTRIVKFIITDARLISKASVKKMKNQMYTGAEIEPEPQVTMSGQRLIKGTDYTVKYENNINAGTARVVITGIGRYAGTRRTVFKITAVKLSSQAKVDTAGWKDEVRYDVHTQKAVQDMNGDGTSKAGLVLKQAGGSGTRLTENKDYKVSYINNTKPGTATMVFTGIGRYTGVLKKTFQVVPVDLNANIGRVEYTVAPEAAYAKKGARAEVVVKYDGITLEEGRDYRLSYKNNRAVTTGNEAQVTIAGTGAFCGKIASGKTAFKVVKADLAALQITAEDVAFKDKPGKFMSAPVLTDTSGARLTKGKDYKLNYYVFADGEWKERTAGDTVGLTAVGGATGYAPTTVRVVATALAGRNYVADSQAVTTYRVTRADMSKAKITVNAQRYTGKEIALSSKDIVVRIGSDQLVYGKDYEIVSYENNIRKGTASVTIKGVGNYGGTRKAAFKITSRSMAWWRSLAQ